MKAELIKGLREVANWIVAMSYNSDYAHDELKTLHYEDSIRAAADALEAAEKRIDGLQKLVDINTERCEALRKQLRESHEGYEKRIAEMEAQLPKEGEWIWDGDTGTYHCSECNATSPQEDQDGEYIDCPNYCPNCGAKMKGEQHE